MACSSRAAAIAFSCSLRSLATSFESRSPACACSSVRRRCSASTSPRWAASMRASSACRAPSAAAMACPCSSVSRAVSARCASSCSPSRVSISPRSRSASARAARLLLNGALLDGVDLVVRLAQLVVRVVEARLQPLLALGRLLAVWPSSATFSLAATRFRSNPMRALFEIAARPVELPDLVLVVEDLALFGVERVAQIEDVLLFLVDDLAQPQELALLGEGGRLREPLARLLDLLAQRLPLVLQRMDARLQLGVARLGLARAPVVASPARRTFPR